MRYGANIISRHSPYHSLLQMGDAYCLCHSLLKLIGKIKTPHLLFVAECSGVGLVDFKLDQYPKPAEYRQVAKLNRDHSNFFLHAILRQKPRVLRPAMFSFDR